jgi:hypothetical protein
VISKPKKGQQAFSRAARSRTPFYLPAKFTDVAGTPKAGHVDVSGNDPSWSASAGRS